MSRTYYEILGVPSNAGDKEIRAAYHRLARMYHPDKMREGTNPAAMEAEFTLISTAYNVIKDPEKRRAYDQGLELKRQQDLSRGGTGASDSSTGPSKGGGGGPSGGGGSDKTRASVARRAYLKGLQMFAAGDYVKAAEFFEVAVKNNDREGNYHAKLAQTLLNAKRSFSRATEAAKKAIELDPYNSEYRLVLASLYEAAGSTTLALQTYQDILKWDPTNEAAVLSISALKPTKLSFFQRLFKKKS